MDKASYVRPHWTLMATVMIVGDFGQRSDIRTLLVSLDA